MKKRDCKTCAHHTEDGCQSWDCEYINREEAVKAWKELHKEESNGKA